MILIMIGVVLIGIAIIGLSLSIFSNKSMEKRLSKMANMAVKVQNNMILLHIL